MPLQQKRIKKKELKQDPLMQAVADTQAWLSQHGVKLLVGLGVLVVAIVASLSMSSARNEAKLESVAALARAGQNIQMTGDQEAYTNALAAELEQVANEYQGTDGGAQALYSISRFALEKGGSDSLALARFERFVSEYPNEYMLTTAAHMGMGTALENLGRYQEAASAFERAAARKDADHVRPILQISRARCLAKLGQSEVALELLDSILSEDLDADLATSAKLEMARIRQGLAG